MVSSGLKVLLSRADLEFDPKKPFMCLYDKSCVLATMSQKNQLKIDLILTSGMYKLAFIEEESTEIRKLFVEEGGLSKKPFTFKL